MSLKSQMALRFVIGAVVMGAMLFIPAGTFKFWQGWAYLMIWFVPGVPACICFYKHDPKVLERRLQLKEKVREQKLIMRFIYLIYFAAFLLPGLSYRFSWSHPPLWLTIASLAIVFGGYTMALWVMKVNSFASRTIQVEPGQRVVTTGPYRIVRHPMYLGMSLIFLFTPLALNPFFALPAFALLIPFIVLRLLNEEKVLRQELPGYAEYCLQTQFRLVSLIW